MIVDTARTYPLSKFSVGVVRGSDLFSAGRACSLRFNLVRDVYRGWGRDCCGLSPSY